MIEAEKITQLTQQIVAIAQPEKVILFGSYAHGQPDEDSDLDIMVILPFEGHWAYKAVEIRQQLPTRTSPSTSSPAPPNKSKPDSRSVIRSCSQSSKKARYSMNRHDEV
jgi:Polymerase beta, Nucleotidyltransferase